jgi:PKD domain
LRLTRSTPRLIRPSSRLIALLLGVVVVLAFAARGAAADEPAVPTYGEVERFGGFASTATYEPATTSGLTDQVGEHARFVYPVGVAVDTEDPTAPDHYAIYVLEEVNPQALNNQQRSQRKALVLEYRIQKLNDHGEVLAATAFKLHSSASEEELHAISLTVSDAEKRVYVLISDMPAESTGNVLPSSAAVRIDAWTTALAPADGAGELPEDKVTHAGELAGPETHPLQGATFVGDVDAESIAVAGSGAEPDVAVAGNRYTSEVGVGTPVIERFKTAKAHAGELDGEWTNAAATEDPAASERGQGSEWLYAMSSDPGLEALNVTLGPHNGRPRLADDEPNMATVSANLSDTEATLPWADTKEDSDSHTTEEETNPNRAATDGFPQDVAQVNQGTLPSGATSGAGTVGPSVVQLAGDAPEFPSGLYAGLVTSGGGEQDPNAATEASWQQASGVENNGTLEVTRPSILGIRVFDANKTATEESSLGMIGNITPGGPCNLQGGSIAFNFLASKASFVALAPGRDGVLFALVQPDLVSTTPFIENAEGETEPISPASRIGGETGDQVVEFAPGQDSAGAGGNASKWHECPQPSGGFSVANETTHESLGSGTSPVTVPVSARLKLDASEINRRGGAVWAYDWNLEDGAPGGIIARPWTVNDEFGRVLGQGPAWEWPTPTVEHTFTTPGEYKAKLSFVSDFGTLTAEREIRVAKDEPITKVKVTAAAGAKANAPEALTASATVPQFDSIVDYHWEFGDGHGEDTTGAETEHEYAEPGEYHLKLTVTDALGQKEKTETSVDVAAAEQVKVGSPPGGEEPRNANNTTPVSTTPGDTPPSIVKPPAPKPLTNAQKLARAVKACKRIKAKKKRVSCEALARRRYGPKKKTRGKKGHG